MYIKKWAIKVAPVISDILPGGLIEEHDGRIIDKLQGDG